MKGVFNKIQASIKNKLIILFLILLSIAIITISYLELKTTKEIIKHNFIKKTIHEIEQADNMINLYLQTLKEDCKMLATNPIIQNLNQQTSTSYVNKSTNQALQRISPNPKLHRLFKNFIESHSKLSYVYITTKNGSYIQWPKKVNVNNYNPKTKPFYKKAIKNKEDVIITDPYYQSFNKSFNISLATTIDNDHGKTIGVQGMDIKLDSLVRIVEDIKIKDTGYIILATDEGIILANPKRPELNFQDISSLEIEELNNIKEMQKANFETVMNNKGYFISLYTSPQTNLKFISIIEKAELMKISNQISKVIFWIILIVVIAIIILNIILTNKCLQPLTIVTNFAQNISNNFSDDKLSISSLEVNSNDEIGELAIALNKMQDRLYNRVTRLNETNEKLYKKKKELQKYFDISEVIFLVLNQDKEVTLINKKGCEILGYSQEEIIGKDWFNNFVKKGDLKLRSLFTEMINENPEAIKCCESEIITNEGEFRKISWHNTILRDKNGGFQEMVSSGIDITEKELLKAELKSKELKTEFFASLSHELKTPLNIIFSALKMLDLYLNKKADLEESKQINRYLNMINQNGYRVLRLVNNLIDINKINNNSFELDLQDYDIVEVIKEIVDSVKDYIENKDRVLHFNIDVNKRVIACDPFNIERIMLNLLSNAVKFTDEDDIISVNIKEQEENIMISVKDTGVGIPEAKQDVIFKRYGQADKSLIRNSEGSGIGLSIVKLLVEMHDGGIRVESEYGKGSEFIVKLPVKRISEEKLKEDYRYASQSLDSRIGIEFCDVSR
ncbi:ATP-binding protein [Selenihalanaerobacter shriftii]|nr:ATP-binding protein [Selenihalanaerobacter shriftii]